jgi:hypothetical protein
VLETSGRSFYSKILNVNLGTEKESLVIYPNPVTGGVATLRLSGLKADRYSVQLINMVDQKVSNETLYVTGSAFTKTVDFSALKSGVYSIVVTGNAFRESQSFIVQ